MPLVLTSTMNLGDGLTNVLPLVKQGFDFMTQEPMIYYVVLGLLGTAIGIFAAAKRAAH